MLYSVGAFLSRACLCAVVGIGFSAVPIAQGQVQYASCKFNLFLLDPSRPMDPSIGWGIGANDWGTTVGQAAHSFIEGHGLQLIHDPCPQLHHPVPVPQQLPHIAILPARHPDPGKPILHQQAQNMSSILPIGLLLADSLRSNLGGVTDPQIDLQFA